MFDQPLQRCLVLLVLLLALAGCSASPPDVPANSAPHPALYTTAPTLATPTPWTGTITMYAQRYTPNQPHAQRPLQALQVLADQYEQTHPGITIAFVPDVQNWNNVLAAKAQNRALYDVFWAQWYTLNGALPQSVAVNLRPYFDQPNPYVPQAATWRAVMNETIVEQTAASSTTSYNINGDFVATAFFYNKALFGRAKIAEPPTSWAELLAVARQLKQHNIPAAVGVPYFSWWARHFLTDFYAQNYAQIAAYDGVPGISTLDEAVAINNGFLSTRDPRFLAWWPVFKEFTNTWEQRYLALEPERNTDALKDFMAGKAAMYYGGSEVANQLRDANLPFEYGMFNFPVIGNNVTEFSTSTDTANAAGGPSAAFQYAISTPEANASMDEPGKFEAVLDWLRFIGTPAHLDQIVNEDGSYLPTWPGITAKANLAPLQSQVDLPTRTVRVGNITPSLENELQQLFTQYLSGGATLDQITPAVQRALDQATQTYAVQTGTDFSKYR